jgi:aryl-alcohol dehydrogenase-like predicted oxidoreductase
MTLDTTFAARSLGKHGPVVSALGLGCMAMPEFYGQRICTTIIL